jgi:XTP/dITP diphosphohydrolase
MMSERKIVFATGNAGKIREVGEILKPTGFTTVGLKDFDAVPEPDETELTFEGNAGIKAIYYAKALGVLALAEDSGIIVDGLYEETPADGGPQERPGVWSARWSGETNKTKRDKANNDKIREQLREQGDYANRMCRYVAAMVLATPEGEVLATVRGECEGLFIDDALGDNGFGMDPHFLDTQLGRTYAQLTPKEKNARSHRARATALMLTAIQKGNLLG